MHRGFNLNGKLFIETKFYGYFVSCYGDVAKIELNEDRSLKKFFLLNHEITHNGYHRVEINDRHYLVHRLVYESWSLKQYLDPELVIDHMDANPHNNYIMNLRQVTQKENISNAICHGNFGHNHNTKIKVYNDETDEYKYYDSVKDFYIDIEAPEYMIKHGSLSCLKKRKEYNKYKVTKINEH